MGLSRHVIVTGPGKSGGSLLMYMLTELGIDTGFPKGKLSEDCGGKYEKNLRGSTTIKRPFPYVLKEPQMCADIDLRIKRLELDVDHIYIMLRRPGVIANAMEFIRRGSETEKILIADAIDTHDQNRIFDIHSSDRFAEGLNGNDVERIERGLTRRVTQLVHLVAEMDIPHTLVSYPRFAAEPHYAYSKFEFLMKRHKISFEQYKEVAARCVDQEQVKYAYDNMPEWVRAMLREKYVFRRRL